MSGAHTGVLGYPGQVAFGRVHLLRHAFQPVVHAAPVLQPAGEHALQLRTLILRHGRKAARFRTLARTTLLRLVITGGCRQVVTQVHRLFHILQVFIGQSLPFRFRQVVVFHRLAEPFPPALQLLAVHLTDLVAQHRPHEVLGYILRRLLRAILHVHQVIDKAAVHAIERNAGKPFVQLVGQSLPLTGLFYVVIQFLGKPPAVTALARVLYLCPHVHVASEGLHLLRTQAPQTAVPLAADLPAQLVYLCLGKTIPIIIPRAVAAVVTGLRHRHLQVVGIRLLLHPVSIAVSSYGFGTLALFDSVGQVLNRSLKHFVPAGQPVHRGLHLFRVASVPVDGAAQTEQSLHRTAYRLDTAGNDAHRFGQVDAFQTVQRLP